MMRRVCECVYTEYVRSCVFAFVGVCKCERIVWREASANTPKWAVIIWNVQIHECGEHTLVFTYKHTYIHKHRYNTHVHLGTLGQASRLWLTKIKAQIQYTRTRGKKLTKIQTQYKCKHNTNTSGKHTTNTHNDIRTAHCPCPCPL